ncbi:MAG: BON domain-containing protein [Chloroflexota bacterium]
MRQPGAADLDLERAVTRSIDEHGLLTVDELDVHVRRAVVYLDGFVPNLKQKRLAGEVASQVAGTSEVVNLLKIAPLPVVSDDTLRQHVRRALARDPRIDTSKITVDVVSGVVYLGGFAGTVTERRVSEHEAWAAPGVRDIINKIEVLSAAPRSDLEVVAEIKRSLADCLGLDTSRLRIEVRDGTAYLHGLVPTDYLKGAAEELATWTPSVRAVVNELTVLDRPGPRVTTARLVLPSGEDATHATAERLQRDVPR